MRRLLSIAALTAVFILTFAAVAWGHPSENRSLQSTFGGPHCHTNVHSGTHAFPSHRAHIATGLPNTVFQGLTDCPSVPGEN